MDEYLRSQRDMQKCRFAAVELPQVAGFNTPGYPQKMMGMSMSEDEIKIYWNRGEVQGMRSNYLMAVKVLMTVTRVLPDDPYHLVMETD